MKNEFKNKFVKYFKDILDAEITIKRAANISMVPFFIQDMYNIMQINLFGENFILITPFEDTDITPAQIRENILTIKKSLNNEVIFTNETISSHNRNRLIKYKIPFVIPNNQMYLPNLLLDLREHYITAKTQSMHLSPSAQVVILYILINKIHQSITPSELAKKLNYSNMTLSRAFNEIESFGLASKHISGKERHLITNLDFQSLWNSALPNLRTPIKNELLISIKNRNWNRFRLAGLSALSKYSMLAPPLIEELAISKNDYENAIRDNIICKVRFKEDADAKLEIWNYSPRLNIEDSSIVDQLSLYLSLCESKDERIISELDKMMSKFVW
ncbi:MAG: hypothetical protein V1773_04515 [bacterium]